LSRSESGFLKICIQIRFSLTFGADAVFYLRVMHPVSSASFAEDPAYYAEFLTAAKGLLRVPAQFDIERVSLSGALRQRKIGAVRQRVGLDATVRYGRGARRVCIVDVADTPA
jgi:hypothetical protein